MSWNNISQEIESTVDYTLEGWGALGSCLYIWEILGFCLLCKGAETPKYLGTTVLNEHTHKKSLNKNEFKN